MQIRRATLPWFLSFSAAACLGAADQTSFKFHFGPGDAGRGYTQVAPTAIYSKESGYGFEPDATPAADDLNKSFFFSVAVPEGNYRITVTLGDSSGDSDNTIKAELRRLMLEKIHTAPRKSVSRTFIVNVRTPKMAGGGEVKLKERERTSEFRAWDEKLTVEFNGARPRLRSLEIERADDVPTVYLLGDSTVCDQPREPWNSWGQMLPRFFAPDLAVANHAESGETLKSSLGAGRLDKVLSLMKPGDYLFIQFGHNDMKDRAEDALATYKSNLKRFVNGARQKGGTPVLVTSMERKAGVNEDTLRDYPATVRAVAAEENVALIDLHAMSKVFYQALGPDKIDKAFQDGTHHNNYGSYELAQCIVQGIRQNKLGLAKHIVKEWKNFDPARPDPVETFAMPPSPGDAGPRPLGD